MGFRVAKDLGFEVAHQGLGLGLIRGLQKILKKQKVQFVLRSTVLSY